MLICLLITTLTVYHVIKYNTTSYLDERDTWFADLEREDKSSPNFDYKKVKTITSISNIHEENKKKYQVFQFDIYNEPRYHSNYVKLNADKELKDFLTSEMDISVRKLDIAFLLEGVSHYDILEAGLDYSFSELSKAENLLSQNSTPEIEVICIYDGELDVEKIETFVKNLYKNNTGYEIQLCFIQSGAEDIKDLLKVSHDDWYIDVVQLEFDQLKKRKPNKSNTFFDYQKVKTITSVSNIHEENKKKYQVFQFDIYNEPR